MTTRLTREQILARARAATANDVPQVVGYSEAELAKRNEARATIERLRELRALWSAEDRKLAAQRVSAERAPILPPPPEPEPAPADDAPQTKRSAGCGLEPPPDTHRPFPLVRVLRPGVPHSRVRPSRPDSAPQPPTAPRRRPAAPPEPTMRERLSARLRAALQGLLWAGVCGW